METVLNKLLGIGITDLLMNLLSCHGFMKDINYTVILFCPSRMLEYYFSKGFVIMERNSNNSSIISNEEKQMIHEMYMYDSDCVMTYTTTVSSI